MMSEHCVSIQIKRRKQTKQIIDLYIFSAALWTWMIIFSSIIEKLQHFPIIFLILPIYLNNFSTHIEIQKEIQKCLFYILPMRVIYDKVQNLQNNFEIHAFLLIEQWIIKSGKTQSNATIHSSRDVFICIFILIFRSWNSLFEIQKGCNISK